MGAQQLWFGIFLTAWMAGTGLVSAWRQVLVLRNDRETMPAAAFFRAQAFRRLFCSLLLIALGVMMGLALAVLEGPAQTIVDERDAADLAGTEFHLSDTQERFASLYGLFWVGFLVLLFVMLAVLAWDMWLLRRLHLHSLRERNRQKRQIIESTIEARREND
jgi:hypothetical protein